MGTIKIMRHGDIMIKTFDGFKIPSEVLLVSSRSLFKGQQHEHYFKDESQLMGDFEGKTYLKVLVPATVDHEEHGVGEIPAGEYYVERKLEYDHMLEESRQVVD